MVYPKFKVNKMTDLREMPVNSEKGYDITIDVNHIHAHKPSPEQIEEQLKRLLASPRFASSQRCQTLLKYVVEMTLHGNAESLKERNIGIDIFKRDPAYDTNADPTVRVAVSEIRKKLAQYYYEPGNQDQVRIELPTGSYAAVFSLPESTSTKEAAFPQANAAISTPKQIRPEPVLPFPSARPSFSLRGKLILAAVVVCVLILATAISIWRVMAAKTPFEVLWGPLLKSPNPVLLCTGEIGAQYGLSGAADANSSAGPILAMGPSGVHSQKLTSIILNDAVTLAQIAGVLRANQKGFSILGEMATSYADIQKGPVVLIGSFNNNWTMHFTQSLRYRFSEDSDHFQWISDQMHPSVRLGLEKVNQEIYGPQEYALIARFFEPEAKQPIIVIAGVTPAGTLAAGELISNPQYLKDALKTIPRDWQTKNLELVITTNVIDNQPGPPRVVASAVW